MYIDTHTHLYDEQFDADRDLAVQRAIDADVQIMLLPAIDRHSAQRQDELWQSHPDCFRQMIGLHPTSVNDDYENELAFVENSLSNAPDKYVAIGEIGLDFYWDTTYCRQQEDAFLRQLDLADRYHLPVSLHLRNAYDRFFHLLQQRGRPAYRGVLHCYSGTLKQAFQAIEMGFCLGIGGVLTYKKSELPAIVQALPLECLLLETDAPYLAPTPFRGRRNESAYLHYIAQCMADIKQVSLSHIADSTTDTAKRLFLL